MADLAPPPPEPQSIVDVVRGELATLAINAKKAETWASRRFAAIADALLILLPDTPPPGKHVVDDVPPDAQALSGNTMRWSRVSLLDGTIHPHDPEVIGVVRVDADGGTSWYLWTTTEGARELAAQLLSAVARAEKTDQ